ncbi:MAG: hypothetical protein H7Z14_10170 [Anaerolineae bacterium]|nr:hypothetical protein [Phycisphaerae bacterium]
MPTTTTPFCTDVDLLNWEPNIFRDAPFASQTLLAGTGTLSGTEFTIGTGSFEDAGIDANHVIVLGGDADGCFPIASVDATQAITVRVMNEGPENRAPNATGSLPFVVRTFWPQRMIVSELIAQAAGVGASTDNASATILNPEVLSRACALGTLQMIYSALAAAAEVAGGGNRAALSARFSRRGWRGARAAVDLAGDGRADAHRMLNVLNFQRA